MEYFVGFFLDRGIIKKSVQFISQQQEQGYLMLRGSTGSSALNMIRA